MLHRLETWCKAYDFELCINQFGVVRLIDPFYEYNTVTYPNVSVAFKDVFTERHTDVWIYKSLGKQPF